MLDRMAEKLITVITPCYNGFRYMGHYFDSLEHQSYRDFRVIIVDDCSTDDSYERLLEYKNSSPLDITILHNATNQKQAFSRLIGAKAVTTEWMCFCDCDDWYEPDFLEKMLSKAESTGVDLVMCHFNYVYADGSKRYLQGLDILSDGSSKEEYLAYTPMSLCRFILRAELFHNLNVPQISSAEDGAVTPQLLAKSKKTVIIHEGLYNYFIRDDSMSAVPTPQIYQDFITAQGVIDMEIGDRYPTECEFIGIKNICYGAVLNGLKADVAIRDIASCYRQFHSVHPGWYKNPYKKALDRKKKVFLFFLHLRLYRVLKIYAILHQKVTHRK
jgi:glycosyltransferase involved in cell wall biosynthesis